MIAGYLYGVLTAQAPITALVATRIHPLVLPEDPSFPALTYQIVSSVSDPTFDTRGVRKYRVQIDCWGDTYSSVDALRDAVLALDGYADGTILNCWQAMQTDFFEHDLLQYRAMVELYILSAS